MILLLRGFVVKYIHMIYIYIYIKMVVKYINSIYFGRINNTDFIPGI